MPGPQPGISFTRWSYTSVRIRSGVVGGDSITMFRLPLVAQHDNLRRALSSVIPGLSGISKSQNALPEFEFEEKNSVRRNQGSDADADWRRDDDPFRSGECHRCPEIQESDYGYRSICVNLRGGYIAI